MAIRGANCKLLKQTSNIRPTSFTIQINCQIDSKDPSLSELLQMYFVEDEGKHVANDVDNSFH